MMKNKLLRYSLLSFLAIFCGSAIGAILAVGDAINIPTSSTTPFALENGTLVGDRANFKDGTID